MPFEERDGKDRPVLVVAAEKSGRSWLPVQLPSKSHQGDAEFVAIGAGAWDSAGRPSRARALIRPAMLHSRHSSLLGAGT